MIQIRIAKLGTLGKNFYGFAKSETGFSFQFWVSYTSNWFINITQVQKHYV